MAMTAEALNPMQNGPREPHSSLIEKEISPLDDPKRESAFEELHNCNALKVQLEYLLEQLAPLDRTRTLNADQFKIDLPAPRTMPKEVISESQEAEPAARLSTLTQQLEQAVKESGEQTMEGGLLRGLGDYAEYMAAKLKAAGRTTNTEEVDTFVDRELRSCVLTTIREFCTEMRASSAPSNSLEALQKRLQDIGNLEAATEKQTDVQSKKASLHNAWDGVLQGIAFVKAAVEQQASLWQPSTTTCASAGNPSSSSSSSSSSAEELASARAKIREERARMAAVQEVCHDLQEELLRDQSVAAATLDECCSASQRVEELAREAECEYEQELAGIIAYLAPRLPSLHAKYARATERRAEAAKMSVRVEESAREWELGGGREIKSQLQRLETTKGSVQACSQVLQTMSEGCENVSDKLHSLLAQREGERQEVARTWVEALCDLQDRGRMSLSQTLVKNQALKEELEEEKARVAEEVEGALERLDMQEEETLKIKLQGITGRINAVVGEIKSISHKLKYIDDAFQSVLVMLEEGRHGVPLSHQEKLEHGIAPAAWAFWVGRTLVRDRSADIEAFALQHRQQRLEQLRKHHKREFEVIQRMKESLQQSQSLRSSPAKGGAMVGGREEGSGAGSGGAVDDFPLKRQRVEQR